MAETDKTDLTQLTVQLLSAYVANNSVASEDLAALIKTTRTALLDEKAASEAQGPDYVPAVTVRKSLGSPEYILSLIDGKPYKMLKRHLAQHGLTPDQYRERYGLPRDYPMTAKSYSEARRATAARTGLGSRQAKTAESGSAPAEDGAASLSVVKETPSTPVPTSSRKSVVKAASATKPKSANATGQSSKPEANTSAPVEQEGASGPVEMSAEPVNARKAAPGKAAKSPTQKAQRKTTAKANETSEQGSATLASPAQDASNAVLAPASSQPVPAAKPSSGTRKKVSAAAKSSSPSSRKDEPKSKPRGERSSEQDLEGKTGGSAKDMAQTASSLPTISADIESSEGPKGNASSKDIAAKNETLVKDVKPAKRARKTLKIKTQA